MLIDCVGFSLFYLFIIYFYWNIVNLPYCLSFWCTIKWLSFIYIYVYIYIYIYINFSYSFPLWFITGYWIEFSVVYRRIALFMYFIYSSLYLLIPNWIIKKARKLQKNIYFALLTMPKSLTVWITTNCGKFLKRWEYQTTLPASWEICVQVKKQ